MSRGTLNCKIIKEIAVLKEGGNGWKKELNIVSWHGKQPKYDIRWWSPCKKEVGKGMTLTSEELHVLKEVIPSLPENIYVM